ncbi:sensor histidine kinase [Blautia sp. MSJ-19]|uniref:sensor histidine kinase n=1 Tax=Blautia sp. MSJ-19 TaxID=2841517 RepID=UPI001C0EA19E|nr:histidine kinase [Blautia sp. MSJ-19]MBU5480966.1 sensor histidine kinase [Blautia sp. MSJ-19]
MKLRTKIFLMFSILATVPLIFFTVFCYQRYIQTTYERMDVISSHLFENAQNATNETLNSIRQTAGTFNFYYDDGSSIIGDLKKFKDINTVPDSYEYFKMSKNFKRTCQNLLYSNEDIYGIYIFTPSGYIFNCTNGENGTIQSNYDFQNADWYQDTLNLDGAMYVSSNDVHDCFTGDRQTIFFTQCLKDIYTHEVVGVLMLDCDADMLDLSAVNTMPDVTLLTIDNTDTNAVLYTNYNEVPANFTSDGIKTQETELNLAPLRLTMVMDYANLSKEFNVTGILIIVICVACIVGYILFAYIISRYMVRPIEHLSRKMSSQSGHALIQSTRYLNRTDEIGTLYNEYNAMVESLNSAVKQDYQDKLVLLDAQMKSLEARINSHFLFNTLEAINSIAELEDNETIAVMSLALGNMFRYTLKTQSELVTVQDELGHVNDYVTIQQIRFDNRFHLDLDIPDEYLDNKVLKLILQPLVENALYHGLNYCTTGDTITIRAHVENGCLLLDVHDNGQGMDEETLAALQKSLSEEASFTELGHRNKQSIGLKNIHSRIELYYGHGYGLTVTSKQGEWTNVQIRLPVLK